VQTKKQLTMAFKKEQITNYSSEELLTELINYQGDNLMGEIVRLGIQQLMELDRDEHIGVGSYERGDDRRSHRNGYKSRQLYTRVGTLVLRVPQTRDGEFLPYWNVTSAVRKLLCWLLQRLISREYRPVK